MSKWVTRASTGIIGAALFGLMMTVPATAQAATPPPYFHLVNHDGKCLDMTNASRSNGAQPQQWTCNQKSRQFWDVYSTPKGYLIKNYNSGKCLSTADNPGAKVVQEPCDRSRASERWDALYSGNGTWFVYASLGTGSCQVDSNTECAIHPSGSHTANGLKIFVNFPNPINGYLWKLGARI